MPYKIDNTVMNITTKCDRDFSCLAGDDGCICEIIDKVGKRVTFVSYRQVICNYRMQFGGSYLCQCPTRAELNDKYDI